MCPGRSHNRTVTFLKQLHISQLDPAKNHPRDLVREEYILQFVGFAALSVRQDHIQQGVKILLNPILSYFLAKSYFILFFWQFCL